MEYGQRGRFLSCGAHWARAGWAWEVKWKEHVGGQRTKLREIRPWVAMVVVRRPVPVIVLGRKEPGHGDTHSSDISLKGSLEQTWASPAAEQ